MSATPQPDEKIQYEFTVLYEIEFDETKMFEFLNLDRKNEDDRKTFFKKIDSREVKKEITSTGDVIIMAVTAIKDTLTEDDEFASDNDDPENIIKVIGCVFEKGKIKNMQQTLEFDENAKRDVVDQINKMQ